MASAPYNPSEHVKESSEFPQGNECFHPQQDRIFLISLTVYRFPCVNSSEIMHKVVSSELNENCNLQSKLLTRLKFSILKCKLLVRDYSVPGFSWPCFKEVALHSPSVCMWLKDNRYILNLLLYLQLDLSETMVSSYSFKHTGNLPGILKLSWGKPLASNQCVAI